MQTALRSENASVEDYLAAEEKSQVRHEYLGGLVYAMAGETRTHNQVVGNLYLTLRQHLKGGPCRLYMSDVRVNFRIRDDEYYYYPDLVVTCDPRDTHPRFIRHPKLIIEVLSESTGRVDRREKFLAYTTIPSLEEYVLVPQSACSGEMLRFRLAEGWRPEKLDDNNALRLDSIGLEVARETIYEGT